jgi:hypothetical protein
VSGQDIIDGLQDAIDHARESSLDAAYEAGAMVMKIAAADAFYRQFYPDGTVRTLEINDIDRAVMHVRDLPLPKRPKP